MTNEQERKAAEQEYTVIAFDYPSNPVGSRDWMLFWQGWKTRAALASQVVQEPCAHSWRDFGQHGGRNTVWCGKCDALAFAGSEYAAPPAASTDGVQEVPRAD